MNKSAILTRIDKPINISVTTVAAKSLKTRSLQQHKSRTAGSCERQRENGQLLNECV